jgi:hypothetical protein
LAQAVSTEGLEDRQTALSARRSFRKRPTSSPVMCIASAAEPPLPQTSMGKPWPRAAVQASVAASIAASGTASIAAPIASREWRR